MHMITLKSIDLAFDFNSLELSSWYNCLLNQWRYLADSSFKLEYSSILAPTSLFFAKRPRNFWKLIPETLRQKKIILFSWKMRGIITIKPAKNPGKVGNIRAEIVEPTNFKLLEFPTRGTNRPYQLRIPMFSVKKAFFFWSLYKLNKYRRLFRVQGDKPS